MLPANIKTMATSGKESAIHDANITVASMQEEGWYNLGTNQDVDVQKIIGLC